MKKPVTCPNCESFIGSLGDLDFCPICGYDLIEEIEENDNDSDYY